MDWTMKSLARAIDRRVVVLILLLLTQPLISYAELLVDLSFEHDGRTRDYDLYVPGSVGEQPAALVLDLHALSLTKTDQRGYSGFDVLAEQEGFFVAFPNAISRIWNVAPGDRLPFDHHRDGPGKRAENSCRRRRGVLLPA